MPKVMLEVRELTTKYITRFKEDIYAVDHVSLKVEEGRSLGIAGESGCGKSTLALSLMGYYFPRGLIFASEWKIADKVPHIFAINSVAGSFAVVLALSLGVRIGYQATIIIAVLCYCLAGLFVTGKHEEPSAPAP